MPNTKSAKKRLKQSIGRRARNRSEKSVLKSLVRKVRTAIAAGQVDQAKADFRLTARKLDKAASVNVIHANAAARVKSRLSAAIKKAEKPAAAK
jgi:small subunit ribosomal protein S20